MPEAKPPHNLKNRAAPILFTSVSAGKNIAFIIVLSASHGRLALIIWLSKTNTRSGGFISHLLFCALRARNDFCVKGIADHMVVLIKKFPDFIDGEPGLLKISDLYEGKGLYAGHCSLLD